MGITPSVPQSEANRLDGDMVMLRTRRTDTLSDRQSGATKRESGTIHTLDQRIPIGKYGGQRELVANEANAKHIHHTVAQALHHIDKTNELKGKSSSKRFRPRM